MFKLLVLVMAILAVAAAQYLPYAYSSGLYRGGYYGGYTSPYAYTGLGYRGFGYGAYPYLG